MTNREIAKIFDLYAKLLVLHDENSFKIRSYQNSYNTIRQISDNLIDMDKEELIKIQGIGKSIAEKIIELQNNSTFNELEKILDKTPPGVVEMMKIKGIGPKKIRLIWKELGVESLGELEYAISENRLTLLKGFGKKTQDNILEQIAFLNSVKGFILLDKAENIAAELLEIIKNKFHDFRFELTGELRRKMPVVSSIDILTTGEDEEILVALDDILDKTEDKVKYNGIKINILNAEENNFGSKLFDTTGPKTFVDLFENISMESEEKIFESNSIPFIPPVFRDSMSTKNKLLYFNESDYIEQNDIKGVIHNHSQWSDGANSILDMAKHFKKNGYEYMVLTDHSKSAFYANGVRENQIDYYLEDIEKANRSILDFTIFSGIESDILIDGSLDYDDDILERFDLVIASVHSVLRMDKEKATNRLLAAIKNPYSKILGHMTGRILNAREGYPLDYDKIFEACLENDVAIELNANPHRLDVDWTWLQKAQDYGVKISINPDAHNKYEVDYIKYGVLMAQKGLLMKTNCLNIKDANELKVWLK